MDASAGDVPFLSCFKLTGNVTPLLRIKWLTPLLVSMMAVVVVVVVVVMVVCGKVEGLEAPCFSPLAEISLP